MSEGLHLINSLIQGTEIQEQLIEWKKLNSFVNGDESDGLVGKGYWTAFRKRWDHEISGKTGKKFELDRSNWTTYKNFCAMYDLIIDEMVDAGVVKKLDVSQWMDINGNIVEESEAFGCKVTHEVTCPKNCFVVDEVGSNTSMKSGGSVAGEKLLVTKGTEPQQRISTKDKHFTVLGLTALNGEPALCVIIFSGKQPNMDVESGIDIMAEVNGKYDDADFHMKNLGPGKMFPGGPTCTFNGVEVPCMCRWTPKGSITSDILRDMIKTLDELEIVDCLEGKKPFLLQDGHASRFELPFLEYIIDDEHEWVVCIGVPYGISLWQVGDATEQNGLYKIYLYKGKDKLLKYKLTHMMSKPSIESTDIIPLHNYAWENSFAKVESNKKAIAERGWNPLNRNLLLNPQIRSTMTQDERDNEEVEIPSHLKANFRLQDADAPNFDPSFLEQKPSAVPEHDNPKLNTSQGFASFCIDKIIDHNDKMEARERIKQRQRLGKSKEEMLDEIKGKFSSGKLFKSGNVRIGQSLHQFFQKTRNQTDASLLEAYNKAKEAHTSLIEKANLVLNGPKAQSPQSWSVSKLRNVLLAYKRKGDKGLPKNKPGLLGLYFSRRDQRSIITLNQSLTDAGIPSDTIAAVERMARAQQQEQQEHIPQHQEAERGSSEPDALQAVAVKALLDFAATAAGGNSNSGSDDNGEVEVLMEEVAL